MKFDERTYTFSDAGRFSRTMTIVAVVGIVATLAGAAVDLRQFAFSWLVAFSFWTTIIIGALFMTMVHHLTGAKWSVVLRRITEAAMDSLKFWWIFALPMLLCLKQLYPWIDVAWMHEDETLAAKLPYLNVPFFVIRTVFYFAVWVGLAVMLRRISLAQDAGWNPDVKSAFLRISAPGMILFALVTSFAAFDWWMSLQPSWYSTIYGVYFFSGGIVGVMAFIALVVHALHAKGVLTFEITKEHQHDIGKLLFAFMIFWAYMALSQYLLIWYANIPEETSFFKARWIGSWKPLSVLIAVGGFTVPFVLMMNRTLKRTQWGLSLFAIWMLVMHWVDVYWNVTPILHTDHAVVSWMDVTALLGLGGAFLALFWRSFTRAPVLPVTDPKLQDSIEFVNQ